MKTNKLIATIVDPQPLFREGVKGSLQSKFNIEISESSNTYHELKNEKAIDMLIICLSEFMSQRYQIEQLFLHEASTVKVVLIANDIKGQELMEAIRLGVDGLILKNMDEDSFHLAIKQIIDGLTYIDAKLSTIFLKGYRDALNNQAESEKIIRPRHLFTKRECEILQLLTDGLNNHDMAEKLKISEKTVKNHVSNLFKKMQVHSRTEAVVQAIKNNWVILV